MFFSKKSQGQVIGVLLLILITVTAVVLVSTFATKFVKNKLAETDCVDVEGKIAITNNLKYTCYDKIDESNGLMRVQIHVGPIEKEIEGFTITLNGASSEPFEIIDGSDETIDVMMFSSESGLLTIPSINAEKTYIISATGKPDSISVYPILKGGRLCGVADNYAFIDDCD